MGDFKRKQFRKWFVVFNNPGDDFEDKLKILVDTETFRAVWGQREIGTECGTEHLQVQIYCKKMTYKKMIKIIHDEFEKGHVEHVRNEKQCDKYTVKDDTLIKGTRFEYGDVPKQGKRSDLDALREKIKNGANVEEVKDNDFGLYARYKNVLKEEIEIVRQKSLKESILKMYENVNWKVWQKEVLGKSELKPDGRKVHWYWESDGCVGKSFLARYLCANRNVYYITGGKQQDILFGYNNEDIIVYDLPRVCEEHMQAVYSTIECFKNGMYLSTKYDSRQRFFNTPHVFVFANYEPDYTMLSQDRWDVIRIKPENVVGTTDVGRSTTYGNNSVVLQKSEEHLASLFKAYDDKVPSLREARSISANSSVERWRNNRSTV